jgi:hypothetical protein
VCRTSTAEEACAHANIRPRAHGDVACVDGRAARAQAAALHYLRTGEEVLDKEDMDVTGVASMLRSEALGASACGDCAQCMRGDGCKRASNREAARRGKRGALWAEEAQSLAGRVFQVCICSARAHMVVVALNGCACALNGY